MAFVLALPLLAQLASRGAPARELLTDIEQLTDAVRAAPRPPSPRLRPTAAPAALPRLANDERRGFARQCPGHVGTPRLGPARPLAPGVDDPDVEAINSAYESHVQFYTMAKAFSLLIAVMMLLIAMFAECVPRPFVPHTATPLPHPHPRPHPRCTSGVRPPAASGTWAYCYSLSLRCWPCTLTIKRA